MQIKSIKNLIVIKTYVQRKLARIRPEHLEEGHIEHSLLLLLRELLSVQLGLR